MWLEITYRPVSLFSLRRSDATNPAAKSLLCPSPYSIKMALLNSIITFGSVEEAIEQFNTIKSFNIQFKLPKYICANNCFIKIQKEPHSDKKKKNPDIAFDSTVGFREFIYYNGDIAIAVAVDEKLVDYYVDKFKRINYFGKRGCFFQFIKAERIEELDEQYSGYFDETSLIARNDRMIIRMDDFHNKAKFDNVNTYSTQKAMRLEKLYYLNYKMVKANKNYTLYERSC